MERNLKGCLSLAKNVVRKEVVTGDFDPEFKDYPEDLVIDVSPEVLAGVVDGWVSFEDDENNLVQIEEWRFAKFVEIWQKERGEAIPAVPSERWGVQFKQWSVDDGRMLTKGWETSPSEADSEFVDEAEALEHVAELEMKSGWFTHTRVAYRAVRLG